MSPLSQVSNRSPSIREHLNLRLNRAETGHSSRPSAAENIAALAARLLPGSSGSQSKRSSPSSSCSASCSASASASASAPMPRFRQHIRKRLALTLADLPRSVPASVPLKQKNTTPPSNPGQTKDKSRYFKLQHPPTHTFPAPPPRASRPSVAPPVPPHSRTEKYQSSSHAPAISA